MDLAELTARLVGDGFDIVHPFPAHEIAVGDFARLQDRQRPVGLLVGNTRALWDVIDLQPEHPFDTHTEIQMEAVAREYGTSHVLAHRSEDGRFFPFQRLAVAVGLAALAPSQLLIHPTYGPWFALRAVVLAPGTPPPLAPRVALPCVCADHGCVAKFDHAMAHPDDWRAWLAVRDACPIGRAYRYTDDQLAYHYTKDRRYLP